MAPIHETCIQKTGVSEGMNIFDLHLECIWNCRPHLVQFGEEIIFRHTFYLFLSEYIKEFSDGAYVEDGNLKCYMHCVFSEAGLVDGPEERVNIVRVYDLFNKTEETITVLNMLRYCLYPEGDNLCEKAFSLNKCWKKADSMVTYRIQYS